MTASVSVVIPAHNDADFIGAAIHSALSQSHRPLEIIVIDDGSTDHTAQVARRFGDPVRVIEQPNAGAAVARTRGLEEARGEFLAFLDADDYWFPDKLAAQVRHLEKHAKIDAVYCRWAEWRWPEVRDPLTVADTARVSAATEPGIDLADSGWIYSKLLLDCIVHTSTLVLRRELVTKVGAFDSRLRKGQDYDYWLRCSRVTPFHKLDRVLSLYRIRADSITRRVAATNYAALVVDGALAKWGSAGPDGSRPNPIHLARRRGRIWSDFAHNHLLTGDSRTALVAAARSLERWPFDLPSMSLLARAVGRRAVGR